MSSIADISDDERERAIDNAYRHMTRSVQEQDARRHWFEMVDLVRERSPNQIRKMERLWRTKASQ